jgi:predicted RNA-binding protein with RPS1 domain
MNSDSTVSTDKPVAEAESVAEQLNSVPDEAAPDNVGTTEPHSSASGNDLAASDEVAAQSLDPPEAAAADSEAAVIGHQSGEPSSSDAAAAELSPAVPAAASEPSDSAAEAAPVAPVAEKAVSAEDSGERRKLRLNPTLPGGVAKAVPWLGEKAASAATPHVPEVSMPVPDTDASAEAAAPAAPAPPPPPAEPVEIPAGDDLDARMEAEIAAAMQSGEVGGDESAGAAADIEQAAEAAAEEQAPPTEEDLVQGAKLNGIIQSIHEDNVFLDFGLRQSGVVSKRQFGVKKEPKVGDRVDVVISKIDEDEGLIVCSLPRGAARISGDWNAVIVGQTVECMVTKTNKGGLEVSVSNLRGFMPASQVDIGYVSDLTPFVGQKLTARVTEVNPGRRRLVLSRRAILAEERAEAEAELLSQIQVGQTCTGLIKTIKDYGAFVDIGGVDGFLHIGQMSWVRIEHPSELLSEGQEVEVKVLSIEPDKKDPEKKRIGLGMRQLVANPWASAESKFPKGSTQTGTVTRTEAYGAFVELEPGVEGLVHISELDHKRVKRVTEVLNVGQQAEVQVLEVDPRRKRISLSVKALTAPPESASGSASDEDLAPGQGQPYERKRKDKLKGGIGGTAPGGLFGNPNDFS